MKISGKEVRIIVKDETVTLIIDTTSVTMTKGEWSKLISIPERY